MAAAHAALGSQLAIAELPARDRTLAVGDAGALPFYSDFDTVDLYGLNDSAIAHGERAVTRFEAARPAVAVLPSPDGESLVGWPPLAVRRLPGYVRVGAVNYEPGYWLEVLVRVDLPLHERLAVETATARAAAHPAHPDTWTDWLRTAL